MVTPFVFPYRIYQHRIKYNLTRYSVVTRKKSVITLQTPPRTIDGNNLAHSPLQKEQDVRQGCGRYRKFPGGGSKGLKLRSVNTDSR